MQLLANGKQQFIDANGAPLASGKVYFYAPATLTPATTYQDAAGVIPNTNPVNLDSSGQAVIWGTGTYRQVVKDSAGNQVWDQTVSTPDLNAPLVGLSAAAGAALVGFQNSGTGAITRTVQDKQRDVVSVKDYGAKGDGTTDDTAAFLKALAASATVTVPFGVYVIKNVDLGTNNTIIGNGSVIKPAAGASYAFRLTGYRSALKSLFFDDQLDHITHGIGTNAAVIVQDAAYPVVEDCWFVNVYCGMLVKTSVIDASHETTKGRFSNLRFDTVTSRGIYVGPNVNTCTFENMRMYVGVTMPDNIPKRGCIGFQMVSTGSLIAYGGHMIRDIDIEQAEHGFQFTDATLSDIQACYGDSLAGTAFQITGNSSYLKFTSCFGGSSLIGFEVTGTSNNIWIDSADTIFNGVVPGWTVGPAAFYNTGSPFDISVKNTASVLIGSWFGDHKLYVDSTATLAFEGGAVLYSATPNPVAAGVGVYFGPVGAATTDIVQWVAPRAGVLYGIRAQCATAPGAGQTFTYGTRVNGSATGLVAVISGASMFDASGAQIMTFSAGQNISVSLITSGGAAASTHRLSLSVKYF